MKKFREFMSEAKAPKIPAAARKKVVKELAEISKKKWPNLKSAIDEIWKALIDNGIQPVDSDGEKFEGMFMGTDSDTKIDIAPVGGPADPSLNYPNYLVLSWYKISDKAWEINAYVS